MPPQNQTQSVGTTNDDIIKVSTNIEFNNKLVLGLVGAVITGLGTVLYNQYNNANNISQQITEKTEEAAAVCAIGALPINVSDPKLEKITVVLDNRDGSTSEYTINPRTNTKSQTVDITGGTTP